MMAAGYDWWLSKASTCFLLLAYEDILNETDALFRVMLCALERIALEFDSFYDRFDNKCSTLGLTEWRQTAD